MLFDEFLSNWLKTDEEKRERGDSLGIFYYISCWFFLVLLLVFSEDPIIQRGMLLYLFFDVLCFFFIVIYLVRMNVQRKIKDELDIFKFPKLGELSLMFFFVIVVFIAIYLLSMITNMLLVDLEILDFGWIIFEYFRVIPTEELVFRGIGIFLVYYIFSKLTYHNQDSREEREINVVTLSGIKTSRNQKSEWERKEAIIWWVAIIITSIMFGFYHFPKYYDPNTFPYFFRGRVKVHIFFPMFYLILLGFGLGLCRYKYGLVASILLHTINNYFASGMIFFL